MEKSFTMDIRVRYVDTDQMGIVHHANYLNWFEVARTEWLRDTGITYRDLEKDNIIMPVTSVNIQYKKPAKYDEVIQVTTWVESYNLVRLVYGYEVTRDGELLATGFTEHTFITRDGAFVRLHKTHPEYSEWSVVRARNSR